MVVTAVKSPCEVVMKKEPRFHGFGCDGYVMMPDEKRCEWNDKAQCMKFVGYSEWQRDIEARIITAECT